MSTSQINVIQNDNIIDTLLNSRFVSRNRTGYVEVGEEKICLPIYYQNYKDEIDKFSVRNDDVFLCSFPKTGSTWISEAIWLLSNNLDYQKARSELGFIRFHHLELISLFEMKNCWWAFPQYENFEYINSQKSPRFIKSHLHWSLLPKQIINGTKTPKIIVTLRNPQDTCISYYHWCKSVEKYNGTFEEWCELFLAGRVSLGPFWSHVLGYWHERHRSNILFIKYADVKKDLASQINRMIKFLDKDVTEEQVIKLADYLNYRYLKHQEERRHLLPREVWEEVKDVKVTRNREVGSYASLMSQDILKCFEEWNAKYSEGEEISFE